MLLLRNLMTFWFLILCDFFSLEALRIYSLPFPSENSCPSFLEFFLNYLIDDFFPSGLLFQFSFFLKSIFVLLCSNLLWFFSHFCDLLSNFQELFLVPPCFLKNFILLWLHLLLPFWGYYWEFFLMSSLQYLFPPYSFFCCSFYIIQLSCLLSMIKSKR